MTEISTLKFNEGTPTTLKNKKYGTNWPVVYIINNNEEAYIGETTDVSIRTNQHLANEVRKNLNKTAESRCEIWLPCAILSVEKTVSQAPSRLQRL